MHDNTYKRLFSFPRVVRDLLRDFVPGCGPDEIDFSTLEQIFPEFGNVKLARAPGGVVWRMRQRKRPGHLILLVEFASREDPWMAVHMNAYASLLYEHLIRTGAVSDGQPLPAVLPVVLYNGEMPWSAAQELRDLIQPVGPNLTRQQPSRRHYVLDLRHIDLLSRNPVL